MCVCVCVCVCESECECVCVACTTSSIERDALERSQHMDGWMDGWMEGRMDGRMDGWMDGWCVCVCTHQDHSLEGVLRAYASFQFLKKRQGLTQHD